jgi:hypothetical protein
MGRRRVRLVAVFHCIAYDLKSLRQRSQAMMTGFTREVHDPDGLSPIVRRRSILGSDHLSIMKASGWLAHDGRPVSHVPDLDTPQD